MAAGQGQAPNADAFDAYFKMADLDRDGRISGAEAVAFFQGSNLPNETLALVWAYAAGRNSYLERMGFYNALRLVTVAQSGRQLTEDIVKAALYGPAAAKIPAPRINPSPASAGQMNSVTTSVPQANNMLLQPGQTGLMRPPSQMNSTAVSAPQANNMLQQSAQKSFVAQPASHVSPMATSTPLTQSGQTGFMRPPASQMNSMAISSPRANSILPQPAQAGPMMPPQINTMVTSTPLSAQAGLMRPPASQNPSLSGQQLPLSTGLNQQGSPSLQNNFMRPPHASQVSVSRPVQEFGQGLQPVSSVTVPGLSSPNSSALSTDWLAGRTSELSGAVTSQVPNHAPSVNKDVFGLSHSAHEIASKPQTQNLISSSNTVQTSIHTTSQNSKTLDVSGNGFSSDSIFGGDVFSASQTKQDAFISNPTSSLTNSSNMSPIAFSSHIVKPGQPGNMQRIPGLPPPANHLQKSQSQVKVDLPDTIQSTSELTVTSVPSGPATSASTQNEIPWPKITQSDIRKYTKVFLEVDKDRDGKITGSEARNLFLSWRLPREVLWQVWNLSDQDNDSMLSMREFCISVYLMERYREGRPLPPVLPNSVRFDQTLILATGQSATAYGASAWQPMPVLSQQPILHSASLMPPTRIEPTTRTPVSPESDDTGSKVHQKLRVPALEQNFVNQLSEEEQKALNSKLQEATDADKKVQELEKEILNCKQKTENYRKQMQELVLYKSRCDSRLNETIERAAADKREVEILARKYEEKYKQTGDVASKLTADQAAFREIQEKKMELYNAIAKMEQGDMKDGGLQERADQIQADLDQLVNALNERCKEYGLRAKPTSLVELPFGWQPGVQGGAADWDESWDKFDSDDGFTIIKELTLEVENVVAPAKLKPSLLTTAKLPADEVPMTSSSISFNKAHKDEEPATFSKLEGNTDKSSKTVNAHVEDGLSRSPGGSPGRSLMGSPSREFQSTFSPHSHGHGKEHHSEHDGAESTVSGEKFTDEITWGATFDSDDTDSVWGFNPIKTKETVHDGTRQESFSGPGGFGLSSFQTDSPSAASVFGKERSPFFDSVPSTPIYNSGFSPKFNEAPEDHSFDSFSQFDSFSMHDSIFPSGGNLARFDSMSSSTDPSRDAFSRFDSFSSTADTQRQFGRFDSMRSTADPPRETITRFDSIKSTSDYNHGFFFDDSDPFESGPFKTSESPTPKKSTDYWSSF